MNKVGEPAIEDSVASMPAVEGRGRAQPAAIALVFALCLAGYVAVGFIFVRHQGFWSPDSAIRFVQVETFRRTGVRDVAVPYPAQALDPEGRFFPAGPWFHFQRAGKHYLSYLPYFPALSAAFYGILGFPGLIVVPMISGLLVVWITHRVLQDRAPDLAIWGAVTVGLGTPLIIYSTVFWDHSPTVALAAAALGLASGGLRDTGRPRLPPLAAAGALLGSGTWLRNEMYLLTAAAVLVWPLAASRSRIAGALALTAGAAITTGLQWFLNARLYSSPLGYKGESLVAGRISDAASAAASNQGTSWIVDKLGNFYYQVFSPDFYAFNRQAVIAGLILGGALLLGGLLMRLGAGRQSRALIITGGGLAFLTAFYTASSRASISGLLPVAPFVILLMLAGPERRWEWFLWGTSAIFAAAVIVTGTHGGLQWGPRYLLPILPALVWLAAAALSRARRKAPDLWPSVSVMAVALLGVSVLVQAAGVDYVDYSIARNQRVNEALRNAPSEVVTTSLEWLALGAGPVYFEKQLMYAGSAAEFKALVERLAGDRVARWSYVPQSGARFRHPVVEQWTAGQPWRFRTAQDALVNGIRVVTYAGEAGGAR